MINPLTPPGIKIALVRGAFMNAFEGQNYALKDHDMMLVGFSSLKSIGGTLPFPVVRLPGLTDFLSRDSRAVKVIANRTFGDMHVLFGLAKYAKQFDIFHTADPYYYYSYQLARLRQRGLIKKLLVTSWETIPHNNETVGKKKMIKDFVKKTADRFLCYTEKARECLIAEGVEDKKISVIPLGVDTDRFYPVRSNAEKKTITVLFVGRLVEEKGILDLYEAFKTAALLVRDTHQLQLRIVGEGPLKNKIMKAISSDGFCGKVTVETRTYEQMPEVYRESDIFAFASIITKTWEEQYGMVLVEAMATGLPVAAYGTGAIPEVLGGAGVCVKEKDIKGLARIIADMVPAKERYRIGTIGRGRVERVLNSANAAKLIANLYRKIIDDTK